MALNTDRYQHDSASPASDDGSTVCLTGRILNSTAGKHSTLSNSGCLVPQVFLSCICFPHPNILIPGCARTPLHSCQPAYCAVPQSTLLCTHDMPDLHTVDSADTRSQGLLSPVLQIALLRVLHMTCAACSGSVEGVLCSLVGVSKATVSLTQAQAEVHYDSALIQPVSGDHHRKLPDMFALLSLLYPICSLERCKQCELCTSTFPPSRRAATLLASK